MMSWREYAEAQKVAIEAMQQSGKIRLLVLAETFKGWSDSPSWFDVSFQSERDQQIEKIAIIGEERLREKIEMFVGKGFRPVDIHFFPPSQEAEARAWVA